MKTCTQKTPKGFDNTAQGCAPRVTLGASPKEIPNPEGVASSRHDVDCVIPNHVCDEIERTINTTIHELVFCHTHLDNDEPEEALDILTTIRLNIDQIATKIDAAIKEVA